MPNLWKSENHSQERYEWRRLLTALQCQRSWYSLGGMREKHQKPQKSWYYIWDKNHVLPEWKSELLPFKSTWSVKHYSKDHLNRYMANTPAGMIIVTLPFILSNDLHSYSSKKISVMASWIEVKLKYGSVTIRGVSLKLTGQHSLLKM